MRNYLIANLQASLLPDLSKEHEERQMLKSILHENILINLRTYDTNSLILYANDHHNNFVHLYINDGHQIVFLYNYGDEIVNLTVTDDTVSTLNSIQVAIIREEYRTRMHVNQYSVSIERGTLLLDEYTNKPWTNPEKGNFLQP